MGSEGDAGHPLPARSSATRRQHGYGRKSYFFHGKRLLNQGDRVFPRSASFVLPPGCLMLY